MMIKKGHVSVFIFTLKVAQTLQKIITFKKRMLRVLLSDL